MKSVQNNEQLPLDMPDKDKRLFEQVNQVIIENKLFLDPSFSREKYIRMSLVNKNKVAKWFRLYAGTNFNGYINALRLEYAISLMKECPKEPIKAIAINSGFNNIRTFYRLFSEKFGVTPVTYKERI